jgi:Lysozyme like domain
MASGLTVARAAKAAGFNGGDLLTAVAVSWAESGWDQNAVNTSNRNGSTDYGLWQINTIHKFPELGNGQWRDPAVNARLAKDVHARQGWDAWSVHSPSNPVGYARYPSGRGISVPFVTAVDPSAVVDGIAETPGDVLESAGEGAGDIARGVTDGVVTGLGEVLSGPLSVVDFLSKPETFVRGIYIAGGLSVAILGGLWVIVKSGIIQDTASFSGKVTGKVAQVVK